jgi:hypothetical protein
MVMSKHVWNPEARFALALARTVTKGVAPYSAEVVRVFKVRAAMPLRESYLAIVIEIDATLAAIERIQRYKALAYNLVLSALTAFFIGVFSFLSRIGYDVVASNPAYREHFPDIFFSRQHGASSTSAQSSLLPPSDNGGRRLVAYADEGFTSGDGASSSGGGGGAGTGAGKAMGPEVAMMLAVQQLAVVAATLTQPGAAAAGAGDGADKRQARQAREARGVGGSTTGA